MPKTSSAPKPRAAAVSVDRVDWAPRYFGSASGYGNFAEQIALAIERAGTTFRLAGDPEIAGVQNAEIFTIRRDLALGEALVLHGDPASWFRDPARRTYGFAGGYTDRVPLEWRAKVALVDEVWAPSRWAATAFENAGARAAYVIPPGVNVDDFPYTKRSRGDKLRFLHFSTRPSAREGADLAVLAFQEAFPGRNDVELVLRATHAGDLDRYGDGRVSIDLGVLPTASLAMYYRSFDALLAPARSEAFGLTLLEAMATGMPAIFTCAGATEQFGDLGLPVAARTVPATLAGGRPSSEEAPWGMWFAPVLEDLVGRLRGIDGDYYRTMALAETDAAAIAANWSWDRSAAAVIARLNA